MDTTLAALFNHAGLRKLLLVLRVPLFGAFVLALAVYAKPAWFGPAIALSLCGAAIQLWGFSCLHKHRTLTVNGPYALVRNPIYVGRFFLILGMILVVGNVWLLVGFPFLYHFYMINRVRREEAQLREIFGDAYERYCAAVPRFVPRLTPYAEGRVAWFERAAFTRNRGARRVVEAMSFWALAACFAFWIH